MICAGCNEKIDESEDKEVVEIFRQNLMDLQQVSYLDSEPEAPTLKRKFFHKICLPLAGNTGKICDLVFQNPEMYACFCLAKKRNLSYEQCLEIMVIELAKKAEFFEKNLHKLARRHGLKRIVLVDIEN